LSGAFIPVSEDIGMIEAASMGALTFDKLEAMTCVCSVGLDMIAIPGDTPSETIAAIVADEAAIGMINRKTTAVAHSFRAGVKSRRHGGITAGCWAARRSWPCTANPARVHSAAADAFLRRCRHSTTRQAESLAQHALVVQVVQAVLRNRSGISVPVGLSAVCAHPNSCLVISSCRCTKT